MWYRQHFYWQHNSKCSEPKNYPTPEILRGHAFGACDLFHVYLQHYTILNNVIHPFDHYGLSQDIGSFLPLKRTIYLKLVQLFTPPYKWCRVFYLLSLVPLLTDWEIIENVKYCRCILWPPSQNYIQTEGFVFIIQRTQK